MCNGMSPLLPSGFETVSSNFPLHLHSSFGWRFLWLLRVFGVPPSIKDALPSLVESNFSVSAGFYFDSMHIFMLLIIPIHEYGMPFISSPDDVLFPSFNYVWDFYLAISFSGCGFSYLPLMPHSCLQQQRMYSLLSTRPGAFGNSMGLEPVPLHS